MDNLVEIFEKSKKEMFYKELDYFKKLNEKQKNTMFYPAMILNFSEYTNYPQEDAQELALFSQLLYYSIEIHEKILTDQIIDNLVILEGDHLFTKVFRKMTLTPQIKNISRFTDYIRNFSEKRIMFIDGLLSEKEVLNYKYRQIGKIIADVIAPENDIILEISIKLSELYMIYLKEEEKFEEEREKLIISIGEKNEPKIIMIVENTIKYMGGVNVE